MTPASTVAPLAYHQERLWFIDEFERGRVYAGPPTYHNIPILLRITGVLDPLVLQTALDALIARHAALRTNIRDGQQVIHETRPLPLAIRKLSPAAGAVTGDDDLVAIALADSLQPFALAEDPLIRAVLYQAPSCRSLLALT